MKLRNLTKKPSKSDEIADGENYNPGLADGPSVGQKRRTQRYYISRKLILAEESIFEELQDILPVQSDD